MSHYLETDSLPELLREFNKLMWFRGSVEVKEDLVYRIMVSLFKRAVGEIPELQFSFGRNSKNAVLSINFDYLKEESWVSIHGDIDSDGVKVLILAKAEEVLRNESAKYCQRVISNISELFLTVTSFIYEVANRVSLNSDLFSINLYDISWQLGYVEDTPRHSSIVHKRLHEFFNQAIFSSGFFEETIDVDREFLNIKVHTKTGEVEICETNYTGIIKQILTLAAVRECSGNDSSLGKALEEYVKGLCKGVDLPELGFQYGYRLKQRS